jgi:hypothetical protein
VGEQFGARADLLAVLLGRLSPAETRAAGLVGARTVRHHVDRWLRARLVVREHLRGTCAASSRARSPTPSTAPSTPTPAGTWSRSS